MQLRRCVVLAVTMLVLAAAPSGGQQPKAPQESAWGRLKGGALRLLPGSGRSEDQPLPTAESQAVPGTARRDERVRPATAVAPEPRRKGVFARPRRARRTLSEYMAWEKP